MKGRWESLSTILYFLLASYKTLISNFASCFILCFKRIVKLYFNEKLLINI